MGVMPLMRLCRSRGKRCDLGGLLPTLRGLRQHTVEARVTPRMRQSDEARVERWREAFERAFEHVPLSLYDEDRKPGEQAFGEMLVERDALREALEQIAVSPIATDGFAKIARAALERPE